MHILVITQYFWPEDFRINDLVKGMLERGYRVTVLTGLPNYPKGQFARGYSWNGPFADEYLSAKVIRTPVITRGNSKGFRLAMNYLSFALAACVVGPIRCDETYDAIFVFQPSPVTVGIPARLMSWLKNAPIVFWVQDLWPESLSATGAINNQKIVDAVGALVRWIYRGCTVVLMQSEAFRRSLLQMEVAEEKIVYFPNSAEALFEPLPRTAVEPNGFLPSGFRVMFAGNLGTAQSLETLIDAADLLRNEDGIHWIIVGDGRHRARLESEVKRRDLEKSVHFLGRYPVDAMPQLFAQADIMVAMLRRDPIFSLTIPAKVQSYLACAKPIIVAIDGEAARVIAEAEAGICVPSEDACALAEAVLFMSRRSPDELQKLGRNGLDYFNRQFERGLLLDRFEAVLQSVARGDK